jgi:formamidopyrimidine-DNA glycosylase
VPELPDVAVYVERLEARIVGRRLLRARVLNPFVLRSVAPSLAELDGRQVTGVRRLGKRIVIGLEGDLYLVVHLMIAGRFRWLAPGAKPPGRISLAVFEFAAGQLVLTEAGSRRRASLHLVQGAETVAGFDRGGLEPLEIGPEAFAERLRSENHTLKRALTDPHVFSGIGNAYSDEILHAAQLSPFKQTQTLAAAEVTRLYAATRATLLRWTAQLQAEAGDAFPEKVTAFRDGMAVHGRFGQPCPVCASPVQRIVYASNEANYCVTCQTGGRLLADRSLSRLLREDWPRSLEELEQRRRR